MRNICRNRFAVTFVKVISNADDSLQRGNNNIRLLLEKNCHRNFKKGRSSYFCEIFCLCNDESCCSYLELCGLNIHSSYPARINIKIAEPFWNYCISFLLDISGIFIGYFLGSPLSLRSTTSWTSKKISQRSIFWNTCVAVCSISLFPTYRFLRFDRYVKIPVQGWYTINKNRGLLHFSFRICKV